MNRDRFIKLSYRAFMIVDYKHPRMDEPIKCSVIAIDFDNETFCLNPLNDERLEQYPQHDYSFWCNIEKVELVPRTLKITHKNIK